MHPPLNGGGVLAEPVGHVITAMPLAHQQHAMQTVIVTGFIGATDLLLESDSHGLSIGNLQCFHAQTLRHPGLGKQAYYTALLMTLYIKQQNGTRFYLPWRAVHGERRA